jgi:hypothetical protein
MDVLQGSTKSRTLTVQVDPVRNGDTVNQEERQKGSIANVLKEPILLFEDALVPSPQRGLINCTGGNLFSG